MQSTKKAAEQGSGRRPAEDMGGLDDELRRWIDQVIVPAMLTEFLNEARAEER